MLDERTLVADIGGVKLFDNKELPEMYRALRQQFIIQTRQVAELEVTVGKLRRALQAIEHGSHDTWAKQEAADALGHDKQESDDEDFIGGVI